MNTMRPLSLSLPALLLSLLFPAATHAMILKTPRVNARQGFELKYQQSISSAGRNNAVSSQASLVTVRSKETGISFGAPADWTVHYSPNGVVIDSRHGNPSSVYASSIIVRRDALSKNQQWTNQKLFNVFMQKATLDASDTRVFPDAYIPSFNLTSSGTVWILGETGLSLSYTGEVRSTPFVFRRISVINGGWLYTFYLESLPGDAKEDAKVFEGVTGSVVIGEQTKSASSATSLKKPSSSSSKRRR